MTVTCNLACKLMNPRLMPVTHHYVCKQQAPRELYILALLPMSTYILYRISRRVCGRCAVCSSDLIEKAKTRAL